MNLPKFGWLVAERCSLVAASLALFSAEALGKRADSAPSDDAINTACGLGLLVLMGLTFVFIAVGIYLLIWVARDAKARGMDGAILWMVLVAVTNVVGMVIYLFARPRGLAVRCSNCQNRRLQTLVKCPYCGA